MQIEYPKTLSVSELHEVDGLVMSKEICNRYNSHELLCNEIERLQDEVSDQTFYKRIYAGVGILSMLTIIILILVNHEA